MKWVQISLDSLIEVLGNCYRIIIDFQFNFIIFSNSFDDIFGMFGKSRTPWWQKENVCIKREVLEEDDEETKNVNVEVSGNANFHMQVIRKI